MATRDDWIPVDVSGSDAEAQEVARRRQRKAERAGARAFGSGSVASHLLGVRGEMAFARYRDVEFVDDAWADDVRRGYDVDGFQVRARSKQSDGLSINRLGRLGTGRFALILGHEAPLMWVVGWITAAVGIGLAEWKSARGVTWPEVPQRHLKPFPGTARFRPSPGGIAVVDPQTPFWCETCGGMHPVIEHRVCRAAAG